MWRALFALALFSAACGGSPSSPSPQPVPTPTPAPISHLTYTGRVVSTQTGAPIPSATITLGSNAPAQTDSAGSFSLDGASSPLQAKISAPGYLTRETQFSAGHLLTVDLIATAAPFSSIFYGQLVRNMLEATTPDIVRTLPAAPAFYLQTAGLSGGNVTRLIAAVRDIVPAMTGGRFTVTTFEAGAEARPEREGWIVIELVNEPESRLCGRSYVGEVRGHIWLNMVNPAPDRVCDDGGDIVAPRTVQHEVGHALGFWHIDVPNALMYKSSGPVLTSAERYHAGIAYSRQSGNRDPDIDASTSTPLSTRASILVID